MSDPIKGFYVSLNDDYGEETVESIVAAVRMIKGVQDVALSVSDADDWMNRNRIRREFRDKVYALYEEFN